MSTHILTRRGAAALVIGGIVGGSQLLAPAMASAADDCNDYSSVCTPGGDSGDGGTVAGEEGTSGTNRSATNSTVDAADSSTNSSSSDSSGALGGTGDSATTDLLGALGLALVGAGTASIVVNRRRTRLSS